MSLSFEEYMGGRTYTATAKIGEIISEKYKISEKIKSYVSEDLTSGNNTVLYTTAVSSTVDEAVRPELLASGVIKKLDMTNAKGINSVKIPTNSLPTVSDLTENTDVSYNTNNYSTTTITAGWKATATKVSQELITYSNIDILADQVRLMGYALSKQIDSDIISAINTATPTDNSNSNYQATGGASTRIDYDNFVKGIELVETNNAKPTAALLHPADWSALMKDTDFKQALAFGTTTNSALPRIQEAFGLQLLVSSQVTSGSTYFVDGKRAGYFVDFTPVITYDGRINSQLAFEVISAKAYGVSITQSETVALVKMSA